MGCENKCTLSVKMKGDDSDLAKKLKDSKKQIEEFKKKIEKITGSFNKYLTALGVATSGYELFTTAVNSNTLSQNDFNDAINTTKETINAFFTAIRTGDWSMWEDGIAGAITKSKKYSQALRQLKNDIAIGDVRLSADEKLLDYWDNKTSDESRSKSDREKAFKEFLKQYNTAVENVRLETTNTNDKLSQMLSGKGINLKPEDVRRYVLTYLSSATSKGKDLLSYAGKKEALAVATTNSQSIATLPLDILAKGKAIEDKENLEEEIKRLDEGNKELAEAFKLYVNFQGDKLTELLDIITKIEGLESRKEQIEAQKISLQKDFTEFGQLKVDPKGSNKTTTTTDTGKDKKPVLMYSTEYYRGIESEQRTVIDEKLKAGSAEWFKAAENLRITRAIIDFIDSGKGMGEYFLLQHELDTDPKLSRLRNTRKGTLIDYDSMSKEEKDWSMRQNTFFEKNGFLDQNGMQLIEKFDKAVEDYLSGTSNSLDEITTPIVIKKGSLKELDEQRSDLIEELNDATTNKDRLIIRTKLAKLDKKERKMLDDPILSNIQGFAQEASEISKLVDAFGNLQAAMSETGKESKKMARAMAYTSAAASLSMLVATMVEKSKNSATVWDWIAAVTAGTATLVSVAAQIKSINKGRFADGGIVGGNSTIGDLNIARVNSGEMILNNRQQRNLFNLLNNGGSTGSSSSNKVEFKIRGDELVGVMNNYNKKRLKV